MSSEETSSTKINERHEYKVKLDLMLAFGEEKTLAKFQASTVAKIIQGELKEVASRANHSLHELLMIVRGDSNGSEGFHGKSRAALVVQALASHCGIEFDVVNSLIVITLDEDDDLFCIEPVKGKNLLCNIVIGVMYQSKLLDEDVYNILIDDLDSVSLEIRIGDFIINHIKENTDHMTATERLARIEKYSCSFADSQLPPDVKLAEVIRIDTSDSSLKWRDVSDHNKCGWVEHKAVRKVSTNRKSEIENDSEASL
ncbi:MAG: hypothetical protein HOA28_04170 [Euryarchaeota archaeon]|jgi:hypothetical protein|nr:hypothetical protein [Euryarchaeota archaeon]